MFPSPWSPPPARSPPRISAAAAEAGTAAATTTPVTTRPTTPSTRPSPSPPRRTSRGTSSPPLRAARRLPRPPPAAASATAVAAGRPAPPPPRRRSIATRRLLRPSTPTATAGHSSNAEPAARRPLPRSQHPSLKHTTHVSTPPGPGPSQATAAVGTTPSTRPCHSWGGPNPTRRRSWRRRATAALPPRWGRRICRGGASWPRARPCQSRRREGRGTTTPRGGITRTTVEVGIMAVAMSSRTPRALSSRGAGMRPRPGGRAAWRRAAARIAMPTCRPRSVGVAAVAAAGRPSRGTGRCGRAGTPPRSGGRSTDGVA